MNPECCLNCEYAHLHKGAASDKLVGMVCTVGRVNQPTAEFYHCKAWADCGGYFEIIEVSSSDEMQEFMPTEPSEVE